MIPAPTRDAPRTSPTSAVPAIAQVVLGVMLFSISDASAKYLRQWLPAVEIAWLRYVVFALFGLVISGRLHFAGARPRRPALQVLRSVTILGSSIFFIAGLSYLPMADAAALSFVSPAFITALSVLFLREQVGLHRWGATIVGLIGVIVIVRPGGGTLQMAALFPLSSAACWAVAMIATRLIGAQDRSETTLLWTSTIGLILLTIMLPFGFIWPNWREVGIGLVLGVAASSGQYLLILAYRRASASILAPFSYIQLLFSAGMGVLVFGAIPDATAFLGAAIIVCSAVYIAYRERRRRSLPADRQTAAS